MKTTVVYHSADFDGLFCRAIARRFLPDADLIGWDFGDEPLSIPSEGQIYVMDLPVDHIFGFDFKNMGVDAQTKWPDALSISQPESQIRYFFEAVKRTIWIDHHASSIASHPKDIPGYRIDGVAACRLAWHWFSINTHNAQNQTNEALLVPVAEKWDFTHRNVMEPWAVRLAGEYDIWDKRDPDGELFQHGLRSQSLDGLWDLLLSFSDSSTTCIRSLLANGRVLEYAREQEYREVIQQQGFDLEFEGLRFLACNSHELDIRSQLFVEGIRDHHQALLGFTYSGHDWRISMYHIPNNEHHDLSQIAVKYGGGGHRGACGFRISKLPFAL